jgi:uncharacterized membrane protein YecN with MAPEG domain
MTNLPITMLTAAAAVFLNIWLGWRIAQHRVEFKTSVGDGGHEPLLRRMRAQSNFIEQAPFFLILLGGLELAGANCLALGIISAVFVLVRIAHGIGMDGGPLHRWRAIGISGSVLCSIILAVWATVCAVTAVLSS